MDDGVVFFMLVSSVEQQAGAQMLLDSLRAFGGPLCASPVWIFEANPGGVACEHLKAPGVHIFPLTVPETLGNYWFARKVWACLQAEVQAEGKARSLVWLAPDCLIVKPPVLFDLSLQMEGTPAADVAMRPVHIKNIGCPVAAPPDGFWRRVYAAAGMQDVGFTVEPFINPEPIRAYFNSHVFAVNPAKGVFRQWGAHFEALVRDATFQTEVCQDQLHQIFLHQAVLSVLTVKILDVDRIRILPPAYSYPYNLHDKVSSERRARVLNDLVCLTYEDRTLDPALVDDIKIEEPLKTWLARHYSERPRS
ncbi:MAG: hypothetical protein JXA33_05970 [Anaerolineae bacterium]|nr:hypothetical protein [Anaerolineae bacterium]